jgi:signal transduction histidine kinase
VAIGSGKLRTVLIAGLAGMLLVFGVAAFDAMRLLDAMRDENQELRQAAVARSRKLASVRSCVLVSQTWLARGERPDRVREDWNRMMTDLENYPAMGNEDASRFRQLHTLLAQHWSRLDRVLQSDSSAPLPDEDSEPLRTASIEITSRLDDEDAQQAAATESAVRAQFENLAHDLAVSLNFALAAALMVAIVCAAYVMRIERQNRGARASLEGLSARLVEAQENERRTISRELHDQVGQTLNAVLVDTANLARRIPEDDAVSRGYLDNIRSYADASVNSIRDIALLLRPSMLDDLGLIPALEWQAREVSRRTGIDIRVSSEALNDSLPDAVRTCVYRLTQEALQNVARHSRATHARVAVKQEVKQDGAAITLTVEDDGTGFNPARTRGLGLLGMEERVRQLGGRLEVRSSIGSGAVLTATLPVSLPPSGPESLPESRPESRPDATG